MLGFFQCMTAVAVECCVIFYLQSLENLMDIIMKFISMAAIARFDDFYAGALFEEKMNKAVGKTLPIKYHRCMENNRAEMIKIAAVEDKKHTCTILEGNKIEDSFNDADASSEEGANCMCSPNPREGQCVL